MVSRPYAITLDTGSSLRNHTGSWRTERPVYVDRLPPCNVACPAGENCQAWLYHAEAGDFRAAWDEIMLNNPLPAIMGRACYHPCQTGCNRATLDSAVNIHAVERFLGDLAIEKGWSVPVTAPPTGKRILVVGAGPSGLCAAYHLARAGHSVTIREAGPLAGGMMRFGIPTYRLPRSVVDAEIGRIEAMGVGIELNAKVDDITAAMAEGGFDACFVAIGAHLAKRVDIPAPDAGAVLDALQLLEGIESDGPPPHIGRRVGVYGGGSTAIDVARSVKRLGGEPIIIYRRTREKMPALDFEVEEALEEGIAIRWLSTIKEMGDSDITVEQMELDDTGYPQPTGRFETIEADMLVLALGQDVDTGVLRRVPGIEFSRDGVVQVDSSMMTGHAGIFAGGDAVPSERTITVAAGHGKKAARCIDAYLRGGAYVPPEKHEAHTFDMLNTWYYSDAGGTTQPTLDEIRRRTTFDEVVGGLDEVTAVYEARRCMSCGNCFECDNCFGMCPDNAIVKLGPGARFQVNYDFCKGCGICATECPCGAISMVPEEI